MKPLTKNMSDLLLLMLTRHDSGLMVWVNGTRLRSVKALAERGLAQRNTNYLTAYELTPAGVECARKLVAK